MAQTAPQFEGGSICGGLDPTGLPVRGGAWVWTEEIGLETCGWEQGVCVVFDRGSRERRFSGAVFGERSQGSVPSRFPLCRVLGLEHVSPDCLLSHSHFQEDSFHDSAPTLVIVG